jgi:hypothetical protein
VVVAEKVRLKLRTTLREVYFVLLTDESSDFISGKENNSFFVKAAGAAAELCFCWANKNATEARTRSEERIDFFMI